MTIEYGGRLYPSGVCIYTDVKNVKGKLTWRFSCHPDGRLTIRTTDAPAGRRFSDAKPVIARSWRIIPCPK